MNTNLEKYITPSPDLWGPDLNCHQKTWKILQRNYSKLYAQKYPPKKKKIEEIFLRSKVKNVWVAIKCSNEDMQTILWGNQISNGIRFSLYGPHIKVSGEKFSQKMGKWTQYGSRDPIHLAKDIGKVGNECWRAIPKNW